MRRVFLAIFATHLVLAASAATAAVKMNDPTAQLVDPQVRVRQIGDDVVAEYREAGERARIVKIVPSHAAPFYLFDDDGDDRVDRHLGEVPAEYGYLLVYAVPFEDYGLLGAPQPLPPPPENCGIARRVPCRTPEERLGTRPPRP
jgi:hypothetical protein